ncbi:ADP-ribose pyrophosphatase [Photobacterium rosenbergii]|uniref:GDP-mannose pyrophosphatase n=1 Tax=Photobacterium rosenbergii TaxID=294936 RepID=A0A2T3NDI2_9GAMM|nr:NUDIX hydrolase [Photobacterium rosenbergii]PSW12255.1 ADP-ribose pyrophosphatase [Photobacterium rosenbergii]
MKEITTLDSKVVYQNKWMTVREDKIKRQSGNSGIYSVVEKADFVIVLPIEDEHIYLVEQYRYPLEKRCLELPQGSWEEEPNADPAELDAGELREETGLVAKQLTYVGFQHLATGYSSQGYHIFLATGLEHTETDLDDEEEGLISQKVSLKEFEAMIIDGTITDASSVNAYGLAKLKQLI